MSMINAKKRNESVYSIEEIAEVMRAVGLDQGDTVFVHTDLQKFGYVKDSTGYFALALSPSLLFDAFFNVLGDEGTLAVPTFSYSWPKRRVFSVQDTPSLMGSFSEFVRGKNSTLRSYHPLLSVATIGKRASEIVCDVDKSGFGKNSPYGGLYKLNAKFVMVGVPFCSFKDYVEVTCNVPYRYKKYFRGQIIDASGVFEEIYEHSVRYLNRGVEIIPFYDGLSDEEKDLVSFGRVGSSFILCIDSHTAYHLISRKLEIDPFAFIKETPSYANYISLIHSMLHTSNLSESGVTLNVFAIDEEGVEKWIWSISNSELLDRKVMLRIHESAPLDTDLWWLDMVPDDTDIVLFAGTSELSGAEIALSTMREATMESCPKSTAELKEQFISVLCSFNPLLYKY